MYGIFFLVLLVAGGSGCLVVWAFVLRKQMSKCVRLEKALNDHLAFVNTLYDAVPQPIYVRDRDGRLVNGTASYFAMVGVTAEVLQGKTVLEAPTMFGAAQEIHDAYIQAMGSNAPLRALRKLCMNGEERWIDHWIQPFSDASGVVQGVMSGWSDVTAQQRLIQQYDALCVPCVEADVSALMALTGGPQEKAYQLLHAILQAVSEARSKLEPYDGESTCEGMAVLAHQVLGMAKVLGHERLANVCAELEQLCHTCEGSDVRIHLLVQRLCALLGHMQVHYQQWFDAADHNADTNRGSIDGSPL